MPNSKNPAKAKPPSEDAKPAAKPKAAATEPEAKTPAPKAAVKADKKPSSEVVAAASTRELTAGSSSYLLGSQKSAQEADAKLSPFMLMQKKRLLTLRDLMLDSMGSVAQDNLRSRAEGSEASAFGMHQADAGSDAYDRDFALNLLSQEQDALYEIDEALKRIDAGTYGTCEMSGKPINHERLEAIPFTRFTVECQSQIERQNKAQRVRQSVTSLFGLTDDEKEDNEEEEFTSEKQD